MSLKVFLLIGIIFFSQPCFAENNFIKFNKAYSQLGFVAENNSDSLKTSLVNKNIKWTLTLKSVYPSGCSSH